MVTNEQREKLIARAIEAYHRAYAPYSEYSVGAAVLTESGKVYDGVNVENAVYPLTLCAERVAIFKAVSEGERDFAALAVATRNGGTPCGSCRQVMAEFARDMLVLVANLAGEVVGEYTVEDLLPDAFGDADLDEAKA
ncbi:MAG: cytidine deaminase [Chloroflexota bacterium]|nr:cytidine deaminase [Chloroflexota bacterium]